jgi:hypothetical protein
MPIKHTLLAILKVSLFLPLSATAADLEQPKPTMEFNYSNGQVGHHVTGLSPEDAGDIQLNEDPLPAPVPQSSNYQEDILEARKNLPEELNGREKQESRQ